MVHGKKEKKRPALQRHDILTVCVVFLIFFVFLFFLKGICFFYLVLSGSVLLSCPWNCVLLKTLIFRAFFFFYLGIYLPSYSS